MTVRLALLNQDPGPNEPAAALDHLRLDVVDAGADGPDPALTDVRVFRAVGVSGASVGSDGTSVVLSFGSPHLLNAAPIAVVSVASAPLSAAPTAIGTGSPHGLVTGQQVSIAGVLGNTALNGTWVATVTGPSTFTIPVAGNAGYLGGGTVTGPVRQLARVRVQNVFGFGAGLNAEWSAMVLDASRISVPFVPDAGTPKSWAGGGSVTAAPLVIFSLTGLLVSPTVVGFELPHGLGPVGATAAAYVSDVGGNVAANGDWTATIVSGTEVSLPVVGQGAWTGGGTVLFGLQATLAVAGGVVQVGWTGTVGLLPGDAGTLRVDLSPDDPLLPAALHGVRVLANTIGVSVDPFVTLYSFVTLDAVAPAVLGAVALDARTVQVTFYEPVRQSYRDWSPGTLYDVGDVARVANGDFYAVVAVSVSGPGLSAEEGPGPSGDTFSDNQLTWELQAGAPPLVAGDALDSAAYALSVDSGLPAVVPAVAAVTPGFAPGVLFLTLDRPMSGRSSDSKHASPVVYRLVVSGVLDLTGNAVSAPRDAATFAGWHSSVPGRDFSVVDWWPALNIAEDDTRTLRDLLLCFQEPADVLLGEIDAALDIVDPDRAPEGWLPSMLVDLGYPFGPTLGRLSPGEQRRLARGLVDVYRLKGADAGIVAALNFLLGILSTVTYGALGGPGLGSAYLGPGTSAVTRGAEPYTLADGLTLQFSIGGSDLPDFAVTGAAYAVVSAATAGEVVADLNGYFSDNAVGAVAFVRATSATAAVDAASNGLDITTLTGVETIYLGSTLGFTPSGTAVLPAQSGATVAYTGVSPLGITGCSLVSGSGVLAAGDPVNLNLSQVALQNDHGALAVIGGTALPALDFPSGSPFQLGTDDPRERLTFFVNVVPGLTPAQTSEGQAIVRQTRRAGTRPVWRPPQAAPTLPVPLGSWVLGPGGTWMLL